MTFASAPASAPYRVAPSHDGYFNTKTGVATTNTPRLLFNNNTEVWLSYDLSPFVYSKVQSLGASTVDLLFTNCQPVTDYYGAVYVFWQKDVEYNDTTSYATEISDAELQKAVQIDYNQFTGSWGAGLFNIRDAIRYTLTPGNSHTLSLRIRTEGMNFQCDALEKGTYTAINITFQNQPNSDTLPSLNTCTKCLRQCPLHHSACGWCQVSMTGICMEAVRGAAFPAYGATCVDIFYTTYCPDTNAHIVYPTATATVSAAAPATSFNIAVVGNLGFLSYSTAINYYNTENDYSRTYYEFDLSSYITPNTSNIYFRIPVLDSNPSQALLKIVPYSALDGNGEPWNNQPLLNQQTANRTWVSWVSLSQCPYNASNFYYQIDISYPVKYMSGNILLSLETNPNYTRPGELRFNGWSGSCAMEGLRPHIYMDEDAYRRTDWVVDTTTNIHSCDECMMECKSYLGLCGWCLSTSKCMVGSAALHTCPSGWYSQSCPSSTAVQFVYAADARTIMNPSGGAADPDQYDIFNFINADPYTRPNWLIDHNEVVYESMVTYLRFDLSALVGQLVDQASFILTRSLYTDSTRCCVDNKYGLWWLDPTNNTDLSTYTFDTFHTVKRSLIWSSQDVYGCTMKPLPSVVVDMMVKSALRANQSDLIFAMSSYLPDQYIMTNDSFFPRAAPRLNIKMGPVTRYAGFPDSTNCYSCVNKCRLPLYNCGWCANTSKCSEGDAVGPFNNASCPAASWFFGACPVDGQLAQETEITLPTSKTATFYASAANTQFINTANLPSIATTNNIASITHFFSVEFNMFSFYTSSYQLQDAAFYLVTGSDGQWMHSTAVYADVYQLMTTDFENGRLNFDSNSDATPRIWIDGISLLSTAFPDGRGIWQITGDTGQGGWLLRAMYRAMAALIPLDLVIIPEPSQQNVEFFGGGDSQMLTQLAPKIVVRKGTPTSNLADCSTAVDCYACISLSAACGWCDSRRECAMGGPAGPGILYCPSVEKAWFHMECPLDYMRVQPYLYGTTLSAAYNWTVDPSTYVPRSAVLPDALGPHTGAPLILQAGIASAAILWDFRQLPPEVNLDALSGLSYSFARAQAFRYPSTANIQGFHGISVNVDFDDYQRDPMSVNWGAAHICTLNSDIAPWDTRDQLRTAQSSLVFTPSSVKPIFGLLIEVDSNATYNAAFLGSLANDDRSEHPLINVRATIALDLAAANCGSFTEPCSCLQGGKCGWCDSGKCVNGQEAADCLASATEQLYIYTTDCPAGKKGDFGFCIPSLNSAMACQCVPCQPGTFGTETGCEACAPGYHSTDPTLPCVPCGDGTYQSEPHSANCTDCSEYSPGARCNGTGLAKPNGVQPTYGGCCSDQGIRKCAVPEACPGGTCVCPDGNICADGYEGPYCDICVKTPYPYHRVDGNVCEKCPSLSALFIAVAVILIVILCAVLIRYGKTISRNLTSLSIGLSYTQSIGLLRSFGFALPSQLVAYIQALSATNFDPDLFNTECAFPALSFEMGFAIRVLLPVGVGIGLALAYGVVKLHSIIIPRTVVKFRTNHQHFVRERDPKLRGCARFKDWSRWQVVRFLTKYKSKLELSDYKSRIISAFVTFLVLAYLFTTQTALSVFACVPDANGNTHVSADASVACSGGSYTDLKVAAIICLVVYTAGLPVIFLSILLVNRVDAQLGDEKFLMRYGMLFSRYKPGRFYWEILIMLRKFLIGACAIFAPVLQPHYGTAVILICGCAVSVVIQCIARPFKFVQHNFLETALIILYILCMITASAASNGGDVGVMNVALFIFISMGVVLVVCVLVFDIVDATVKLVKRSSRAQTFLGRLGLRTGDDDAAESGTSKPEKSDPALMDESIPEGGVALSSLSSKKALPPTPPPPQARKPSAADLGAGGQTNPVFSEETHQSSAPVGDSDSVGE